jgi:hypothetical protein
MAIRKTIDFKGITVPNAYIQVTSLSIKADWEHMEFSGQMMIDANSPPFDGLSHECPYNLEGGNPVRQAYDFLKTLEKYAGSEDC